MSTLAGFNGQSRMPDACQVSPFSFSRVILVLAVCVQFLCVCVYVCVSDPQEEEAAETAPIFAPHLFLSVFLRATASCHPFPSSARRISRLSSSMRGHFRTRRHVRSSASFFSSSGFSSSSGPAYTDTFAVFFLVLLFANPTISLQYGTSDTAGSRCSPSQHSLSFQEMRSSRILSSPNTMLLTLSRAALHNAFHRRNKVALSHLRDLVHFTLFVRYF